MNQHERDMEFRFWYEMPEADKRILYRLEGKLETVADTFEQWLLDKQEWIRRYPDVERTFLPDERWLQECDDRFSLTLKER